MLTPNVTIPYDSTHASIPGGFSRETTLDGKYPKGAPNLTNPGGAGGASTHTHTSPSHSHSFASHTHNISTSSNFHQLLIPNNQSDSGGSSIGRGTHSHTGTTSALTSETVSSEAVTYSSQSNDPPYYEVIFIKSVGYNSLPNNAMLLNSATSRNGMSFHTASANRFLKGAGTGANAGGTGGSLTNSHTVSHTHSTSHGHTGTTGNNSGGTIDRQSGSNTPQGLSTHSHAFLLDNASVTSDSNSAITSQSESVQPAFRTLNAFKNTSGSSIGLLPGDIAMWLQSLATIPIGWVLCNGSNGTPDMRDQFLKIPASASATTTGGSNTHTHAAQSHTHTVSSHTHTGSVSPAVETTSRKASGDQGDCWGGPNATEIPNHTLSSISSTAGSLQAANTTANSSDNQPEYITVAFIQFQYSLGGAPLAFLM
ncbi:MAG TPA: hypothetical protein VD999_05835 [Vitreimonas sp.]|nr:hypothetical protein [Vitreimonas sp.]